MPLKHDWPKDANWRETAQRLFIRPGVEPGTPASLWSELDLKKQPPSFKCGVQTTWQYCFLDCVLKVTRYFLWSYFISMIIKTSSVAKSLCDLKLWWLSWTYNKVQVTWKLYPSITTVISKQFQGFLRYAYEWRTKPRAMILRNISDVYINAKMYLK